MSESKPTRVVVIGGGPGGYGAAFAAADHGLDVTLVELEKNPGGVCAYRGCIPSKALLHVAKVVNEARELGHFGVDFGEPKIDIAKLRKAKENVISKVTGGAGQLAKARKVRYIQGRARFESSQRIAVETADGKKETLDTDYTIVATGSRPTTLPFLKEPSPRVMDSTAALELESVPKTLLIIGGGYIGLELGQVYATLGSKVTVVEMLGALLPGADPDLVKPLQQRCKEMFENIYVDTKVVSLEPGAKNVKVVLEGKDVAKPEMTFDKVLVSIGRRPCSENLGLENTKVQVNKRGFISINDQCKTDDPHILAIGDVAGDPMLAHKATAEGRVAAEVLAGKKAAFRPNAIPAVVFTDPEVAWCGLTEAEAKAQGRDVTVGVFPWAASGRATTINRNDGITKIIADKETHLVLGVGIAGQNAGEMIAEGVLAVEMGALAHDLAASIHPHPTLSETVMESAESIFGSATHMFRPKKG